MTVHAPRHLRPCTRLSPRTRQRIPDETVDPLLGLDVAALQLKMFTRQRGGHCFEQNMLFRGGLRSLGFTVSSLQARVDATSGSMLSVRMFPG